MWSSVVAYDNEEPAPSARSKHSATLVGPHMYLLGGRNGNLPCKDFWKYHLASGTWEQLKPSGDRLPSLQEHSAVAYKDNIYVFGGEVSFSAGTETPLWVYDIKNNSWRKMKSQKGVVTPKGRRGHTALVHKGTMLIYGGYQDLRGSCSELWAFHFETESWHLISGRSAKNGMHDFVPPARHKHSAVLYDDSMWIYGGMTDLQVRSDLWKWDVVSSTWTHIKTKQNPGPLHSHAACRLPSSMILFGGERGDGHPTNDLWKFSFGTETWEKIVLSGIRPQPRAETVALTISELLLKDIASPKSLEDKAVRTRTRTSSSVDRGHRHSSYIPSNRVSPSEKTYVFTPTQTNYTDGSNLAQQYATNGNSKGGILQEISKLSHLNISRLNSKCNYTILSGCPTDSTENLLRQYASPPGADNELDETRFATPTRGSLVKSKSAFVIKRREARECTPSEENGKEFTKVQKHVEFASGTKKMPKEPISVPNFSLLTLPTPVLTPVEAARLVFLDSDHESDADEDFVPPTVTQVKAATSPKDATNGFGNFKMVKKGESYSSHLAYADNPLYQHMVSSASNPAKFASNSHATDVYDENVSATSDYASIETVNRLSSSSNYSAKLTPQEEYAKNRTNSEGPFGFCNPNYFGPVIGAENDGKSKAANRDSVLEGSVVKEDSLEMHTCDGKFSRNTRVVYKHASRQIPPKSLALEKNANNKGTKSRASSASRAEKSFGRKEHKSVDYEFSPSDYVPLYMFVIGGKEQGQITVFKRPLSIWKLKLF